MKIYLPSLLALCVTFLAAYSPVVNTSKTSSVDLGKYSTFAFIPDADLRMPAEMEERLSSDDVNQMVVSTLNNDMRDKGSSLDRNNPDLLLLLSMSTEQRTDVDRGPVYAPVGTYATYPYTGAYAGRTTISLYYSPLLLQ